jgi:hypothetical protein
MVTRYNAHVLGVVELGTGDAAKFLRAPQKGRGIPKEQIHE